MHDDIQEEDIAEYAGDAHERKNVDDFVAAFFGSVECGMREVRTILQKNTALTLRASGAHRVHQEPHECRHRHDGKRRYEARL